MLETDFSLFEEDAIKSFMMKFNNMSKQMEGSRSIFILIDSLRIRCDKLNEPKDSSYVESPKWFRYKVCNATVNPKISMIHVFSIFLRSHTTVKKSKTIINVYQIVNHFWFYRIGQVYPIVRNKNNYTLFKKFNPEIAFTML